MNKLTIKIVGPAGFGIKTIGQILAKTLKRSGFYVFAYTEYPSLIRGGHNTYQIGVSGKPVRSSQEKCDILIGLTAEAIEKEIHENKIKRGALVISDNLVPKGTKVVKVKKVEVINIPLTKLAKKIGSDLMKNTVALGALFRILDLPLKDLNKILKEEFGNKGPVAEENVAAAKAGYSLIKNSKIQIPNPKIQSLEIKKEARQNDGRLLLAGNQALAMGAVAAGCQVYVAYPMTPATGILHFLEAKQKQTGMLIHQPEDEIAGIHTALGAAFTGARAAVGTSGGGFALMNEGLSLAGMLELPLVLFEVQRPGPATGNPTWTEQGDLNYVINAGHGEFPKVVIAPGLPEECFSLTQHAFNLADKYQIPVIVLSDKYLGESVFTVSKEVFDEIDKQTANTKYQIPKKSQGVELFKRYRITASGVSPRPIPGMEGGEHIANSDEHNELSYSDESAEARQAMMDKRMKKLTEISKEIPLPRVYGPNKAAASLICWGSTLGVAIDAMRAINDKNAKFKVNVVHFCYLWPLPKGLSKFLAKFKKLILVENNKTAQLGRLIRQETGIEIKRKILKYNSRPFWRGEIVEEIRNTRISSTRL